VAGDNWTLVIALQLSDGGMRLSQLRDQLAGVSAGVLDRYIRQMAAAGLLTRTRFREMPPRVELELTDAGRELIPIAGALARWGARRAWSEPERGERVDLDALLRLLPVLLDGQPSLPDGIVEVRLTGPVPKVRHRFAVHARELRALPESSNAVASATIAGERLAWLAALGPSGDVSALELDGDLGLAGAILGALPQPADSRRAGA
jgi:DNA-binding HxlR family transcriptional regulator